MSVRAWQIAAVLAFWPSWVSAAPSPPRPVYTNNTRFRIPYRVDQAEIQRLGAREIRLFVSTSYGANWRHVQSVPPGSGRFDFEADQDGEYWFAVRTLDARNRLHPGGQVVQPGLKVVVDTTPPELDVQLEESAPGRVALTWTATDPHLDPTQLNLEYVQSGSRDWEQVSVLPRAQGKTTWSVADGGVVAVRGTIADTAGNVGRTQTQIEVRPGNGGASPGTPDLRQPVAENPQPRFSKTPNTADNLRSPNEPQAFPDQAPPKTAANGRFSTDAPSVRPSVSGPSIAGPPARSVSTQNSSSSDTVSAGKVTRPAVASNRFDPGASSRWTLRPGVRVRVVNDTTFDVGYEIEDVGPSGVSSVEFYVTTDDGGQWWKYGNDTDNESPFRVNVPKDGVYGFALRARSGVGLAAEPPQPGEKPSIVVVVDRTPPEARLLPIQQGQGAALNKLVIRWQVEDENPTEKPVSLYYSASRKGPWEPITGWVADRGGYEWAVGPGVPSRLYIRLAARDSAGNVRHTETAEPVVVDLTRPSARIVDVESATEKR